MNGRSVLAFLLLCMPLFLFSQEYGYTRYDSKDGLASSTVYCLTQDVEGFMWFGTETGLSRFDGTHFRTFTQDDGLPDNEIIQLFADSKGRVWISPFKKEICYYFRGKIYNQENDPVLKHIHVSSNVVRFAEDNKGNILLMETDQLHLVTADNQVYSINTIQGEPVKYLSAVGCNAAGGFWVLEGNQLFEFNNRLFTRVQTFDFAQSHYGYAFLSDQVIALRNSLDETTLYSRRTHKTLSLRTNPYQNNFSIIDAEHVSVNSPGGAVVYNINKADSVQHFLPGVRVCGVIRDLEGNLWFATKGQGVYRLNSAFVLNTRAWGQILSFAKDDKNIAVGSDRNVLHWMDAGTGIPLKESKVLKKNDAEPIVALYINSEKSIVCGTAFDVTVFSRQQVRAKKWLRACTKYLYPYKNELCVVTDRDILRVDPISLAIKDTIWNERATFFYTVNDTFYVGTINGLYRLLPNGTKQFLGEKYACFRNRIAAIVRDTNNVLWVATFGGGLAAFKDEKILSLIKEEHGLTSNICRTVFLNNNSLWVGTNKGLNKIRIDDSTYPVKRYTTGDGLVSDIINALYVNDSKVFVATPEGVTFFDEGKIASESRCDLHLTDIQMGTITYLPDRAPGSIPHDSNNIQFNYVGISYKSTGDIRYRYRLLGLDSAWHETRATFLNYPTLPSGDYELQLQAINKFDVLSKVLTTRFTIEKLLYEKNWFRVSMGVLFLAVTGLLVLLMVRRVRRREEEKTATGKRINELEQLSRKAQMNPHFIFNSLNSIQQYVMDADVSGANKFISGFSRLIRQTLDFSSKPEISLEEELDYLTNYLEIEKTRLEDAFSWVVHVDAAVDPAEYYIPPMILQPFVENSVRHGLRFRKDKNGVVTITVKLENDYLVCILEDNGIGRKAAMRYKSISPINYQSKGLSLTADRITMFNLEHAQKISMQIDDLEDEQHQALGTRVTIWFPVF